MNTMDIHPEITQKLHSMLEEFVYNVLKNHPQDIYKYSAEYFTSLYQAQTNSSANSDNSNNKIASAPNGFQEENRASLQQLSQPPQRDEQPEHEPLAQTNGQSQALSEDEEDDDLMDMPELPTRYTSKTARRHSVAAESVDPEKIDASQIQVHEKTDEQKQRLNEAVKNIFIFRSLKKEQLPKLIDAMFEYEVEAEKTVINQGDMGDNFYVIEKGIFEIHVNDQFVGKYENQGSFGELALMYNTPRQATIVAKSPGILWAMDRISFLNIVLKAAYEKRQVYENMLASCSILKPLTEYERTNLADALTSREFEDQEEICHEGDLGDEMFFIEEGQVAVLSRPDKNGDAKELKRLSQGGYFGELALLTDGHRNATITAAGKVKLAVLDKGSFERLMGPCVDLMKGQSKTYLDEIKEQLGEEALMQYPALVSLLGDENTTASSS